MGYGPAARAASHVNAARRLARQRCPKDTPHHRRWRRCRTVARADSRAKRLHSVALLTAFRRARWYINVSMHMNLGRAAVRWCLSGASPASASADVSFHSPRASSNDLRAVRHAIACVWMSTVTGAHARTHTQCPCCIRRAFDVTSASVGLRWMKRRGKAERSKRKEKYLPSEDRAQVRIALGLDSRGRAKAPTSAASTDGAEV